MSLNGAVLTIIKILKICMLVSFLEGASRSSYFSLQTIGKVSFCFSLEFKEPSHVKQLFKCLRIQSDLSLE